MKYQNKQEQQGVRNAAADSKKSNNAIPLEDNRPASVLQRKLTGDLTDKKSEAPVQKKNNNTGLPDQLKSGIEHLSGHSMDDVKVHYNSAQPAQLNAHAYAQGKDIHLASGQEKHLPHEAWHVVQQKQGRVKPTVQLKGHVNINDDTRLEKEADVMGEKALQMKAGPMQFASKLFGVKHDLTVQRRLMVNGNAIANPADGNLPAVVEGEYILMTTNPAVAANQPFLQYLVTNAVAIKRQLSKWIENTPGVAGSHELYGRKQQNRNYPNYYELAVGISGWVETKPVRKNEKAIADANYGNIPLQIALNGLMVKLYYKINSLWRDGHVDAATQANILTELTTGLSIATHIPAAGQPAVQIPLGHYQRYHRAKAAVPNADPRIGHALPQNQLEVLRDPRIFSVKDKVILLHDLMEYFGSFRDWNIVHVAGEGLLPEPTADDTRVTTGVDDFGERRASASMGDPSGAVGREARGTGLTSGTRNERAPNTLLARNRKLPVWAGQSMTTARMMKLAEWAGADAVEKEALALSIFSYWRKDYDHTSDLSYHTVFEVMDIAKNFGVHYRMPGFGVHDLPIINLAAMIAKVETHYNILKAKTIALRGQIAALHADGAILQQIQALIDRIMVEDAAVNIAGNIVKNMLETEQNRHASLNDVVVRLEIAAEAQRAIDQIISAIPDRMVE